MWTLKSKKKPLKNREKKKKKKKNPKKLISVKFYLKKKTEI